MLLENWSATVPTAATGTRASYSSQLQDATHTGILQTKKVGIPDFPALCGLAADDSIQCA